MTFFIPFIFILDNIYKMCNQIFFPLAKNMKMNKYKNKIFFHKCKNKKWGIVRIIYNLFMIFIILIFRLL